MAVLKTLWELFRNVIPGRKDDYPDSDPLRPPVVYSDLGGTVLMQPCTQLFEKKADGSIDLTKSVTKIGIDNILELSAYSIEKREESTFHIFAFHDGRRGEIGYGPTGQVETFRYEGGAGTNTPDWNVILKRREA